jgi:uncharacterized membrane protein (DUF441 family)
MTPYDTKPALSSLTINASLISVVVSLLSVFGIEISPDALPHLTAIIVGISSVIAIYGRIRANTLIK